MTDTTVPVGIPAPTLRVIGAGFGRTGTLSMREALVMRIIPGCSSGMPTLPPPAQSRSREASLPIRATRRQLS
jgi:hypothetical protein